MEIRKTEETRNPARTVIEFTRSEVAEALSMYAEGKGEPVPDGYRRVWLRDMHSSSADPYVSLVVDHKAQAGYTDTGKDE